MNNIEKIQHAHDLARSVLGILDVSNQKHIDILSKIFSSYPFNHEIVWVGNGQSSKFSQDPIYKNTCYTSLYSSNVIHTLFPYFHLLHRKLKTDIDNVLLPPLPYDAEYASKLKSEIFYKISEQCGLWRSLSSNMKYFINLLISMVAYRYFNHISISEKNVYICIEKTLMHILNDILPYVNFDFSVSTDVLEQNLIYTKYDLLKRAPDNFSDYAYLI